MKSLSLFICLIAILLLVSCNKSHNDESDDKIIFDNENLIVGGTLHHEEFNTSEEAKKLSDLIGHTKTI